MERLTKRDENGNAYYDFGFLNANHWSRGKHIDRLAAYEDSGLEPEEITVTPYGCVFYCNRRCNLNGDWCAEGPGCPNETTKEQIDRLRELAEADRDGRCMVLKDPKTLYGFEGFYCEICHKWHRRVNELVVGRDIFSSQDAAKKVLEEQK